ncbi:TolC family protein [Rubinisphaera margarita]|uniref:TolC family protein n=1 Tax=Rubinisphaera margarita TaxID=2909586 RepID=UPI001EE93368|nr:TolC family protein [Rubinisphaera margarita]MCG6156579.1 TolC family protein [Rubinisphaera margarita]
MLFPAAPEVDRLRHFVALLMLAIALAGCRSAPRSFTDQKTPAPSGIATLTQESSGENQSPSESAVAGTIRPVAHEIASSIEQNTPQQLTVPDEESSVIQVPEMTEQPEVMPLPEPAEDRFSDGVSLGAVVQSVHESYPLVQSAYLETMLAQGNAIEAWGAFDTKLKASTENRVLSYYQTYRQNIALMQPLMGGGEIYGGYRLGRGSFPDWYGYRQTNTGGEFKLGFQQPLNRNRSIDARRAEIWRAEFDIRNAEPEIRAQVISAVEEASVAFWDWVAYGQIYQIGRSALDIAVERNRRIERLVEQGAYDPPVLQDNRRTIALREATLLEELRQVEQAAVKLSIFYRAVDSTPLILGLNSLIDFPAPEPVDPLRLDADIQIALAERPELYAYHLNRRKLEVDLAEARNDLLANVDTFIVSSNDLGNPTSLPDTKTDPELEVGVLIDVPLQRRKAKGKIQQVEAKMTQLAFKTSLMQDKIAAEVRNVYTALDAAYQRAEKARIARELAEDLARIERRKFELGESELLTVFLREQSAIEAAEGEVKALREYHVAKARYAAALGMAAAATGL